MLARHAVTSKRCTACLCSPAVNSPQNTELFHLTSVFSHSSALFCTTKKSTLLFSSDSALFAKNYRGMGSILLASLRSSDHQLALNETEGAPLVVSFHPVNILLNEVECRVLGSLIEKEITTPEYYPLSLNALLNACNQKSNREPVTNLDEAAVRQALHSLDGQSLVRSVSASDTRVTKSKAGL